MALKKEGFLIGWKEIANYLNVSTDSVKRNWIRWDLPLFFLHDSPYKIPAIHLADLEEWRRKKIEETRRKFKKS